jgi:hypothetical protein
MWLKLVGNPLGMGAAKLDGCDPIALPFAAHFGIKRLPLSNILAERVGFEPTVRLPVQRFSRPSHSTTLAPLRDLKPWSGPAF